MVYPLGDSSKGVIFTEDTIINNSINKDILLVALDYYDIRHPEIVYAQIMLETGHLKSKVFKDYNNLFGLYDLQNKDYYRFNNWRESIKFYKEHIQKNYKDNTSYYTYLHNIGYAEDTEYIDKLKDVFKYEQRGHCK